MLSDILGALSASLIAVIILFLIAKFIGHKQIAQLDLFDYINGITIGSIAAEFATNLEKPVESITAMLIFGGVTMLFNCTAMKRIRMRKILNGSPTILMENGKIYRENMKKAKLELSEFLLMCRMKGYFDLSQIKMAVFEYNGVLTILPKAANRPATPDDFELSPEEDEIFTEIIMDGRILGENLQRCGKNERWLEKQLSQQGYSSAKQVFLAVCDKKGDLSVYPCKV